MDNNVLEFFIGCGGFVQEWLRQTIREEVTKAIEADRARQQPEKMYTREEVCAMLGISKPTLWARTTNGDIPCVKVGRRVFYAESALKKALGQ